MTVYYTADHEWLRIDGDEAVMGITRYAADQLGDIVFADFKSPGDHFSVSDEIGVLESVKAASSIYAPVSCAIIAVNEVIAQSPSMLNADPEGTAWLYRVSLKDRAELDGLMDANGYAALIN